MSRTSRLGFLLLGSGAIVALATVLIVVFHDDTCRCNEKWRPPELSSRLKTPRAALRTFYASISASNRNPARIDEAVACLDLSGMPSSFVHERDAGRLATHVDTVLRALGVRTFLASDDEQGPICKLVDKDGFYIALVRGSDGCWRLDSETLRHMPTMRVAVLKQEPTKTETQSQVSDIPGEYHSPRATCQTFQDAIARRDYDSAGRCLDLSALPAPAREAYGPELAIKVQEIADRLGVLLEQDLPDQNTGEPIQLIARREGRIGIERMGSGDRRGQWLFSSTTVRSVEPLYDIMANQPISEEARANGRTYLVPSFRKAPGLWVRHHLPRWRWLRMHLGRHGTLDAYQLAGLFLVVGGGIFLRLILLRLGSWLAILLQNVRGRDQLPVSLNKLLPSISLLVAIEAIATGIHWLDLRQNVAVWTYTGLSLLQWGAVSWVVYCIIDAGLDQLAARRHTHHSSGRAAITDMLFPLVALLLRIGVVIGMLVALLQIFEMNVATVLAGLGIGGLAFALAAQDSLKNFFGSLTLIFDRTFYVGDLVKIGEKEGKVESVGLRSTRIRALDDALMTIPNAELTTMHVTNYGARRYRHWRTTLGVTYQTPPEKIQAFCAGITALIEAHPDARKEEYGVHVSNLGESAIEIVIKMFFLVDNSKTEMQARDSLTLDMIRLAESLGVDFAYPTRTVQLTQPDWMLPELIGEARTAAGPVVSSPTVPRPHYRRNGSGVLRADTAGE